MQTAARGVELSRLATLILACAMATPAAAVEVPQTHVLVPNVHITPQIKSPKITAPQPRLHTPLQPTVKGNQLNTSKGLQYNAPTGGGNATGGGVKVLQGTPASPQTNPSGGITPGGTPIVDLKTLLDALQQASPPGGGTSKEVSVNLETLRDLLQQCKAGQASPSSGCALNATRIDPAQIQSVIDDLEGRKDQNAALNTILKQAIQSSDPASAFVSLIYKLPSTAKVCWEQGLCWPSCSGQNVCYGDNTCVYQVSCHFVCQGVGFCF